MNNLSKQLTFTLISFCLFCFSPISTGQTTDVYISAHQDDWQLFMNPNAFNSVTQGLGSKTIFIHTTAGDAGSGNGSINNGVPYYTARNEGALRAIRFMVNSYGGNLGAAMTNVNVNLNGHQITRYSYDTTVAYFLNLPDGRPSGIGYNNTGNQSLQRLYEGTNNTMDAVDGSASYSGWDDLVTTIEALVYSETLGNTIVNFHSADTNTSLNPGDHSDHIHSSRLLQDVAARHGCVQQHFYRDYVTNTLANNVSNDDLIVQAATWGATTSGISDFYHSSTFDTGHNAWIGKQYYRIVSNSCTNTAKNIAMAANVIASTQNTATSQTGGKAIDGVIAGWPVDHTKEWATLGQQAGAYLYVYWSDVKDVSSIKLYDRPNGNDQVTSGALSFSDGTSVPVPSLNNNGSATTITLSPSKSTLYVMFQVTGTSSSTINIGLAEIEVIGFDI